MDHLNSLVNKPACTKDRYIAFTIDFIFLMAIFGLFLPPIKKYFLISKLTEQNDSLFMTVVLIFFSSLLLFFYIGPFLQL